jgi:hypothetical protein
VRMRLVVDGSSLLCTLFSDKTRLLKHFDLE